MKKAFNFFIAAYVLSALTFPSSPFEQFPAAVQAAPALAFVSGTVVDDAGKPLGGAVVTMLEPQVRGKEIKSVKTDTQGKFNAGIAPGLYRMRAFAEGFLPILSPRLNVERQTFIYNFALKRSDTSLVEKRGDRDDYRWIGTSVPRSGLNIVPEEPRTTVAVAHNSFTRNRPQFQGMAQLLAAGGALSQQNNFYGTNFALSAALGNVEMAVLAQRGSGDMAPQRLSAYATMRPRDNHQITASIGYGQATLSEPLNQFSPTQAMQRSSRRSTLDQVSVSAVDEWQVFQPLLVIYGFDYSRFVSGAANETDSLLPRIALQYTPSTNWRVNAAYTPGSAQNRRSLESFNTENLDAQFETQAAEMASLGTPLLDRSRRIELGVERLFAEGNASIEASAFYDIVSGHGVGVLALPLEASPKTQEAMQQVAHQVAAMNGAARGARVMMGRRINDYVSVSAGYSAGYGSRFGDTPMAQLTPARVFSSGFFQVAASKLDLDFSRKTGTRVSTVIRLSPSAVIFAIDPFAGRMGVFDPNINIYVTQDLPNFGFPIRWQALVDLRNLLNQTQGLDDGSSLLVTARSQRTVRGGLAFRW